MASLTAANISLTMSGENKDRIGLISRSSDFDNTISFQNPYGLENSYNNISPNIPEVSQIDYASSTQDNVDFNRTEKNFQILNDQISYLKYNNDSLIEKVSKFERSQYQKDEKIEGLLNKLNQLADIVLKNKKDIEVLSKRNLTVNFQN